MSLLSFIQLLLLLVFSVSPASAHPRHGGAHALPRHHHHSLFAIDGAGQPTCREPTNPFDFSAKIRRHEELPVCEAAESLQGVSEASLMARAVPVEDYTCGPNKPCSNGACCPKEGGNCMYGPTACGTTGTSPNDICWSNCNAKAECGRFADPPGKTCPLNVCCSQWGFCGSTADFCKMDPGGDPEKSCQSNCAQPGPTQKDGNVQKRVIGYYEAWNHASACAGMGFKNIPVGGLTHAYFSFAFVTGGDFMVVPMDGMEASLFSDFTAIKSGNSGLKTIIAIGGWTHNDPGPYQTVFSGMVSTAANRKRFIGNLFGFMRKYGFDGADFDWEYPGAPDRGGRPDDGKNFRQFLKELDEANRQQPYKYVISFTIPTSYWYLRHFDLDLWDYVDFVNVMSYDLHGVWDADNPIGSNIFAHSNLTEIKDAMNLLWRNNVPANKVNLGLGFYGRSFTLTNPQCNTPGCGFRGGADPGPCSANSGTLTYREIQEIIKTHSLTPVHDTVAAVKYITWNQNQWVSYDDAETFKQKIEWANNEGLAGLLIWAIDQDTADLEALSGVLAPRSARALSALADRSSYWDDVNVPDCYVTGCGGSCNPGFVSITRQPCGNARPVTRHSTEKDSQLCCPISSAPDPKTCRWRGNHPSCNGHCQSGEITMQLNRWGDSWFCETGNKAYCCDSPLAKGQDCYWKSGGCRGDDKAMTTEAVPGLFSVGTNTYCCPKKDAEEWTNCQWYGRPGNCDDNHCATGKQVQLTQSDFGGGQSCRPRIERQRVFCCDPVKGAPAFSPVSLDKLFPHPPTGNSVETDFELKTDDTWGTGSSKNGNDEDPNDASFSFVVLTSPDELQVSLDKRDGSHWELFNCTATDSEEAQTIQMVCTDDSEDSNCGKIQLGHGVPGTILQMPGGCGPGKYAVAKSFSPAKHQILPRSLAHLETRSSKPIIYDLTFDYNFARVPRDLGNTQMRIDFSNQPGYWDQVVAAAAKHKKKRKRSLDEFGGSHKRWLEEEWRDDQHFGGLAMEELHKRWFGSDILAWINRMLQPTVTKTFRHKYEEVFRLNFIEERWTCPGRDGHVLARADTRVNIETSFGFTLIAKQLFPLEIDSFLVFNNKGEVVCTFTIDVLAQFRYDTGERNLLPPIAFPGASLVVPGIVTIGPALNLRGRIEAGVTISAQLEARLDVVSWEYEYRLPQVLEPATPDTPNQGHTGDRNNLLQPSFYAGVSARGDATVHLIAALQFGIKFDPKFNFPEATAEVGVDGYVQVNLAAGISTQATCPFTWGLKAGAQIFAEAKGGNWGTGRVGLPSPGEFDIYEGGTCPNLRPGGSEKRELISFPNETAVDTGVPKTDSVVQNGISSSSISKRLISTQPLINIPVKNLICPSDGSTVAPTACAQIKGWTPGDVGDELDDDYSNGSVAKRDLLGPPTIINGTETDNAALLPRSASHPLSRRAGRALSACGMTFNAPTYPTSGNLPTANANVEWFDFTNPNDCNSYTFGSQSQTNPNRRALSAFATEHVLELQMITQFLRYMDDHLGATVLSYDPRDPADKRTTFCRSFKALWGGPGAVNQLLVTDAGGTHFGYPSTLIMAVMPSSTRFLDELVLLESEINGAKMAIFGPNNARVVTKLQDKMTNNVQVHEAIHGVKSFFGALKYLDNAEVRRIMLLQKNRVAQRLRNLDEVLMPNYVKQTTIGGVATNWRRWQSVGLFNQWNQYMRDQTLLAHNKGMDHIESSLRDLESAWAPPELRADAFAIPLDPGYEEDRRLITKLDTFRAQFNAYRVANTPWNNPMQ
ncbi:glycosyl hydrolases family 18 protein-like protein [Podospora didyma]|uniref:chitinase n=1 Tax=Podospora didyma TaxID=330526 RepID=A0AAE0NYP6_9PEZI|nr:glycosyl hydrolases family 18 protein-like protein [Podospora didyma]